MTSPTVWLQMTPQGWLGTTDTMTPPAVWLQMTPQGWLGTTDTGAIVKAQQITTEDPAHLRTSDQAMLGRESDMGNEAGSLQHVENSDGKRMTL